MNYPKLLSEELLLITPQGYQGLLKNFEHVKSLPFEVTGDRQYPSWMSEDGPQMEKLGNIAVIPISGPIGRSLDMYDKAIGATDVDDIDDDLDDAEDDDQVEAILLDIDSPGGMVSGTPELAERIAAVDKPIYTFSAGLVCSAAYWLASSTDGIFCTRSADIGCIGVYSTYVDFSAWAKEMGIKVQVFSSGIYKGMGTPGTALSADQAALIQGRIMEIAEEFFEHVRMNRGEVPEDDLQGQWFKAAGAAEHGLIDGIVRDRDEALAMLFG